MASISLRGSASSHTQLYWNEIAINSSMNGIVDLSLFSTEFLEEVEMNYGLTSLEYGSGGIGGAVQLNNKVKFEKKQQIVLAKTIGSFGKDFNTIKLKLGNSKWQSSTKIIYNKTENNFKYKDLTIEGFPIKEVRNANLEQKGLMQSVQYRHNEKSVIGAFLWFNESDRNLPPLITLRENLESQSDRSIRTLFNYKNYIKNGSFQISSSWLKDEINYINERASINTKSITNSYKSILSLQQTLSKKISYSLRANFDINQAESPSFRQQIQRERISLFASVKYQLNAKLLLNAAVRQVFIVNEDQFFLPSLELNYFPLKKEEFKLYSMIGKNAKYPTLNDLNWQPFGNPDLKNEVVESIEFGVAITKNMLSNKINVTARTAVYQSNIEDYILWRPTAFGYWKAENIDQVKTQGIELTANLKQLNSKLTKSLAFNYSYTLSENTSKQFLNDASVDKQLIYIPIHQFNVAFKLEYKSYQLALNHQLIGERFTTSDNTEFLPDYNLFDLSLSKDFKIKAHFLKLQFSILNVFDAEYYAIEWRPMPNRNYLLKLQYQLTK